MRKSTSSGIETLLIPILIIGFILQLVAQYLPFILLIIGIILAFLIYTNAWQHKQNEKRLKALNIAGIDQMSGIEFEHYVKRLMENRGYSAHVTPASSDYGVDIIAQRGADKYAVQVKRYNSNISRKAVSDAVAGMAYYKCNKSMVVTNRFFSQNAIVMAHKTNTILIDRNVLSNWIIDFQKS